MSDKKPALHTDLLIAALSAGARPAKPVAAIFAAALLPGAAIAIALTLALLGPRRDAMTAAADWPYWAKLLYPFSLAVLAFLSLERLARPGSPLGKRPLLLLLPLLGAVSLGIAEWDSADAAAQTHLFYGHSWRLCPFLIVLISAPVFVATMAALRRLAPTRAMLSGAAAGLFAGALGAWIYAFHCGESALTFVAIWYTAGIAAVTLIGAISGRWLLRW